MGTMVIVSFLFKWLHLLAGFVWMGMLYYFNFVQTEYFKEASSDALGDAKAKLAPRALWWFRRGAEVTLLTGVVLLVGLMHKQLLNDYIVIGATLGIIMFLNVMIIIWPNQKIVLGLKEGDAAVAAPKAALASRTNTLFSAPMAFCMLASHQMGYSSEHLLAFEGADLGLWLSLGLVLLLEANAIFGKIGPLKTVRGVIHLGLALSAVIYCLTLFL